MGSTFHGYWGKDRVSEVGALVVSGANEVAKSWGTPVAVKRLILVTTTALTVANAKLTVGVRKLDDSSSTDHSAYTATFTGSAINDVKTILLGKPDTAAVSSGSDGLDVYSATPLLPIVDANEELHITSDAGATAGAVVIYAQIQELGFHEADANTGPAVELVREAV